jgi:S-phase kinase-associated protein 1
MAEILNESQKIVRLISQEGKSFDVPLRVAELSELVKGMVDDDAETPEIPLPNVKSSILAKVIEFCQYYQTDPMREINKVFLPIFSFLL